MSTNIESRARAICAQDLKAAGMSDDQIAIHVERFWPIVAREVSGDIADPESAAFPMDMQAREQEFRRLTR